MKGINPEFAQELLHIVAHQALYLEAQEQLEAAGVGELRVHETHDRAYEVLKRVTALAKTEDAKNPSEKFTNAVKDITAMEYGFLGALGRSIDSLREAVEDYWIEKQKDAIDVEVVNGAVVDTSAS